MYKNISRTLYEKYMFFVHFLNGSIKKYRVCKRNWKRIVLEYMTMSVQLSCTKTGWYVLPLTAMQYREVSAVDILCYIGALLNKISP